jgi:L-lysine 2,3-aminomutase
MDFDHTGEKTGEVSSFVFTYSTERLLAEVKRCDVVCANCHRVRTYQRLRRTRSELLPSGEA